jgi:hypothetical protein
MYTTTIDQKIKSTNTLIKNIRISIKSVLLNIWLVVTTVPGTRDIIVFQSVPLDVVISILFVIILILVYGFKIPNILAIILITSSLFVFINEGVYQWLLSLIILLPAIWSPYLAHKIKLSTKILLVALLLITGYNIYLAGDPGYTFWRIPAKLLLFVCLFENKIIQILIAFFSGFRALLFITFQKLWPVIVPIYLYAIFQSSVLSTRILWNLDRLKYIGLWGTGFMHSSSLINQDYRRNSIDVDRFNQVLAVLDFGMLDMILKLGIFLSFIYLFYYFKIFTKHMGLGFAIGLFLMNITHGYLIHEDLIWETFFVLEYAKRYGYG